MGLSQILVVDDLPNWRDVIGSILRDSGYEVSVAATVKEAWGFLSTRGFDLVILDIRLSDTNPYDIQGIELLEIIKNRLPSKIPAIIMTGYNFEGLEELLHNKFGVETILNKGSQDLQDIGAFRQLVESSLNKNK